MTVTNPDGSVDAVHEFDNELSTGIFHGGGALLTALLANQTAVSNWFIQIGGGSYGSFGTGDSCQEDTDSNYPRRIVATVGRDLMAGSPLRLTGTCTVILSDVAATEGIGNVWTYPQVTDTFPTCCLNNAEVLWNNSDYNKFTEHQFNVNEWPAVQHNQVVSINVVITFQ